MKFYNFFSDSDICDLSPETGTCRGSFERYYFNSESGECEAFEYGGCDANANNFEDKETCEMRCKKPIAIPDPARNAQGYI